MAEKKQINIPQVVNYLNHAFSNACQKASGAIGTSNVKGTKLHEYQVDFAYLINEIQTGPTTFLPKKISDANELINRISEEKKEGAE